MRDDEPTRGSNPTVKEGSDAKRRGFLLGSSHSAKLQLTGAGRPLASAWGRWLASHSPLALARG